MKQTSIYLIIIASLLISFISCKKEDNSKLDFHYDYFAHQEGQYITYDVLEIVHSTGAIGHDTSEYQLKTVIGEPYEDNEGRMGNKFYRYKRESPSQDWSLSDVYVSIIADYRAELVEENQRIIKLVFRPSASKVWDANAFNNYAELECFYDEIHEPFSTGAYSFDSTLTVEQEDDFNLIEYKRKFEVYANDVGLIKKHYQDLRIQNFDVTDVEEGYEIFMDVIDYGFE